MADPRDVVPYHDPYDHPYTDIDIMGFLDDSNPNLTDFDSITLAEQFSEYSPGIGEANDPLTDQVMWDIARDQSNGVDSQAGPSEIRCETSNHNHQQEDENVGQPQNPDYYDDYGIARPLSVWPLPPVPFSCSFCHVLRDIIHTNGNHTTKLEIHGRLGMICHAVLQNHYSTNERSSVLQPQMFDFCKKSIDGVKQFLMEYCMERALAGYIMLQDPLSMFYEALCIGMDWDLTNDDFFRPTSPTNSGEGFQMDQPGEAENQTAERVHKTALAAQRERTGKLTLRDFVDYFHLPIEEAAKRMNLCPTVVKKICRRDGLGRWPHRKIKSISRQISNIQENLGSCTPHERSHAEAEIERLQHQITSICRGGR